MKRYCIRSREGKIEYFDIISENEEGYHIRLTRLFHGNKKTFDESMSHYLFDICIKTGYIFELEPAAATVA
ncbi:MAG: hypothetical protein FWH12_08125 [Treponema sp.]|nr:hypothetical protein [Treponema sp.]